MKLLCVYDPAIILPVLYEWSTVEAAREAFVEHNEAQAVFGFKVAITETLQLALAGVPNGTPATAGGMAIALLGYLTGSERNKRFCIVMIDDATPSFSPQGDTLSPHSSDLDIQVVYDDLRHLLGWCWQNHSRKARFASWQIDQERGAGDELIGVQGERIPIVRSRYGWGEAYRQLRRHPAKLLPNAFISASADEVVFPFHPPASLLEDERDLPRPRLPRNMVESGRWREIGGNRRGFEDCWGNFWMWNPNRRHWDVQITEQMRRTLGADDYHLNVEPGDARIVEGFQPAPEAMRRFSTWQAS